MMRPIVPAVPRIAAPLPSERVMGKKPSNASSPTKSTSSSLNPDAPAFEPSPPKQQLSTLRPVANMSVPTRTSSSFEDIEELAAKKMKELEVVDFEEVESFDSQPKDIIDVSDSRYDTAVDENGVRISGDNVLIFNIDTKSLPESSKSRTIIATLAAERGSPRSIQINILTGPRLPAIHKVYEWLSEAMGQYMTTVERVQITIVRSGEYISSKWMVPELNLEHFNPLINFVIEVLQILPPKARITWGASQSHGLILREQFLSIANSAVRAAFQDEDDKGLRTHSQVIDGEALNKIAQPYVQLQGKKLYTPISISDPVHEASMTSTPPYCILRPQPSGTGTVEMPDGSEQLRATYLPNQQAFNQDRLVCQERQYVSADNHHFRRQQTYPDRHYGQFDATSPSLSLNPDAKSFIPERASRSIPSPQYSVPDPKDPFYKQIVDVDAHRKHDWVPADWELGTEYDDPAPCRAYFQNLSAQFSPRQIQAQFPPHETQAQMPLYSRVYPQQSPAQQMPLQPMGYNQINMQPQMQSMYATAPPSPHYGQYPVYDDGIGPVYATSERHYKRKAKAKKYGKSYGPRTGIFTDHQTVWPTCNLGEDNLSSGNDMATFHTPSYNHHNYGMTLYDQSRNGAAVDANKPAVNHNELDIAPINKAVLTNAIRNSNSHGKGHNQVLTNKKKKKTRVKYKGKKPLPDIQTAKTFTEGIAKDHQAGSTSHKTAASSPLQEQAPIIDFSGPTPAEAHSGSYDKTKFSPQPTSNAKESKSDTCSPAFAGRWVHIDTADTVWKEREPINW